MTTEGKNGALKDWVESKRASAFPPPVSEPDPESDPMLVGIPKIGEEIFAGKYVIERVIGIGGMGVVCAAMHKQLKQRVAIKFLAAQMRSPELVDRFVREGQAAVRIKSEHIAPVLDVGVLDSGTPFLMMEYLEGADLGDYLLEHRTLPVPEAIDFILQALDALAVAHSAGIVHRDLKPSNLFVTQRSDGSPLLKVLDFGISKVTDTGPNPSVTLTRPGTMLGSPRYMSPEQLRNASGVDQRTDVWAIGIVLHELIAGTPPYDADTFTGLCTMIAADPPTPLRAMKPDAPEALEQIIFKCLQKNPAERWQNVGELAQALAPMAPSESRIVANRVSKILGQPTQKTPPGSYTGAKVSNTTPKPERTLPLASSPPRSSGTPSPMATTGRDVRPSNAPLTDPNGGALAISTAKPPAKNNSALFIIPVAALAIGLAAFFVFKSRHAVPVAPPAPPPVVAAAPEPEPKLEPVPTLEPAVAAPAVSASMAPPAVAAPRPRPVAKPAASASAPAAVAPPSEADMLNRRR